MAAPETMRRRRHGGRHRRVRRQSLSYTLQDLGLRIVSSGPDGSDTPAGAEHLRFSDGTIHVVDGSALFDTVYYERTNLDVFHAGVGALTHYNSVRLARRPRPQRVFRLVLVSRGQSGRTRVGRQSARSTTSRPAGARGATRLPISTPALPEEQSGCRRGRRRTRCALPPVRPAEGRAPIRRSAGASSGFDAQYYLAAQSRCGGGRGRSAAPFQHRRLARRTQSERPVRHDRLSRALHRRAKCRHQPVAALRAFRLARGARPVGELRYGALSCRPTPMSPRRMSIRSTIISTAASTKVVRPSPTASSTDRIGSRYEQLVLGSK